MTAALSKRLALKKIKSRLEENFRVPLFVDAAV